eukprot:2158947-Rhodomonas_salina.3
MTCVKVKTQSSAAAAHMRRLVLKERLAVLGPPRVRVRARYLQTLPEQVAAEDDDEEEQPRRRYE